MPFRVDASPRVLLRLLLIALFMAGGRRVASAQTVMVQSAPPNAAIELMFNNNQAATATADSDGDATLAVGAGGNEVDVLIYIDSCTSSVRIQLDARGLQPAPPQPACTRVDVGSMFIMRTTTTFVVDITPSVAVHVSQGPPPAAWLLRGQAAARPGTGLNGTPEKGLVLSAAIGFSTFGSVADKACGNVTQCLNSNAGIALNAGADYWFTRFTAGHIGYLKPADVTVSGQGDTFNFDSSVTTRMLILAGKAGGPIGPVRLYGMGGMNRHEATFTTTETINDTTTTVNGITQTIPGGTQTFAQKTEGWSWMAGGGFEAWVNNTIAVYGEFNIVRVEGDITHGANGSIDESMNVGFIGIRFHLFP